MIWLCGDTHGDLDIDKVIRFFSKQKDVTKDDYLIILGDAEICLDDGIVDDVVYGIISKLPCTVLWVDGNHENFDLIEKYPVKEWNGGKVQFINGTIHLMRGQVYQLQGHSYFVFGGGDSIDKKTRTIHEDWWPQEMPSKEEYNEGKKNLKKAEWKVDYILSHSCPRSIACNLVKRINKDEEELLDYFEWVKDNVEYRKWYFGHFHRDETIKGKHYCLYRNFVQIKERLE